MIVECHSHNKITQPIENINGRGSVYRKKSQKQSTQERSDLLFVDFIKSENDSPGNDLIQFGTSSSRWNDLKSLFCHHLFK